MANEKGKAEGSAEGAPGEPQEGLAAAEAKGAEYYDQLLRLKAEFENFRKRTDREKSEWAARGRAAVLGKLLPIYDALKQAKAGSSPQLSGGLELVLKEIEKLLASEGVSAMETVGKPYHHDEHEVLGVVETSEFPDGTVVEEIQKGFVLNGAVLRPARVRIAKEKKDAEDHRD